VSLKNITIYLLGLAVGIALGHIQEQRWSQIREDALVKQIERQKCSDVNPWK